ncbi:MAG: hypothetical protein JW829_05845, partial [Pirellulales bacterium]|nr:hypothetical protein [Pirellulales bacterium]
VEEGQVEIDRGMEGAKPLLLRDVQLIAKRSTALQENGSKSLPPIEFKMTSGSPDIHHLEIFGTYHEEKGEIKASGKVTQMRVSPQLLMHIPSDIVSFGECPPQIHGLLDFSFHVFHSESHSSSNQYLIRDAKLSDGRYLDPRFSLPLTGIQANGSCDQEGLKIDKMIGRFGEAEFTVVGLRKGWSKTAEIELDLHMLNLSVNQRLVESCPAPMNNLWKKFRPEGMMDVDAQLTFDGHTWIPDNVVARCRNLTLVFENFPYPIIRSNGTIRLLHRPELHTNECQSDLTAIAGGQPIQIESQHTHLGDRALGWIRVTGKKIPIDDALIEAIAMKDIPDGRLKTQAFVKSLHPTGRFDTTWLSWRENTAQEIPNTHLDILLTNCTVLYDKFPYPLRDIQGRIRAENGHWIFEGLQGTNNAGIVHCSGRLTPSTDGKQLVLEFHGKDIALEQDLLRSLQPEMQEMWRQLQPRGRVNLNATLYHTTGEKPTIFVTIQPQEDSVSIKPAFFPYSLEQIKGNITFTDGQVDLMEIRAIHNQTQLRADGECTYDPSGAWQLTLSKLSIDRLAANDDLLVALPTGLRQLLGELRPRGTFGIHNSQIAFRRDGLPQGPIHSKWKLQFSLHQATLQTGIKLENANGELTLEGESDGRSFKTHGEIDLDSLTYRDLQFTEVRGPLLANEEYILLGQPARHLSANIYGGRVAGHARIRHAGFPQFALEAALTDGDLARLTAEHLPGQQNLRGRAYGRLILNGAGRTAPAIARSLTGEGQIQFIDADIYELPQIIRLLHVLRVQDPNKTGFTRSNMKFRIDGEHIQFDQLELSGNAISLYGNGEMGFDRKLNLAFQAVIGPGVLPTPKLHRFLREASGQVMQINVRGTLQNPDFESEPLPGLNHVLQQLQAELEPGGRTQDPANHLRGAQRSLGPPTRW